MNAGKLFGSGGLQAREVAVFGGCFAGFERGGQRTLIISPFLTVSFAVSVPEPLIRSELGMPE